MCYTCPFGPSVNAIDVQIVGWRKHHGIEQDDTDFDTDSRNTGEDVFLRAETGIPSIQCLTRIRKAWRL